MVIPPKRLHVEAEGASACRRYRSEQDQPRLKQVFLDDYTVGPAALGRPFVRIDVDELAVHDRAGKNLPQIAGSTEDQDSRPGRCQPVTALHHEPPLVQELNVSEALVPSRVAVEEDRPVPAHGCGIEELVGLELGQDPAVVALLGGVPEGSAPARSGGIARCRHPDARKSGAGCRPGKRVPAASGLGE